MDTNKTEGSNEKKPNMLTQKTNEDYNKQKPNPSDPNQRKSSKVGEEEELDRKKGEVSDSTSKKSDNRNESKVGDGYNNHTSKRTNDLLEEEEEENQDEVSDSENNMDSDSRDGKSKSKQNHDKTGSHESTKRKL